MENGDFIVTGSDALGGGWVNLGQGEQWSAKLRELYEGLLPRKDSYVVEGFGRNWHG